MGLVIGVAGALVATRVLASYLYEVEPGDPVTLLVTGGVLLAVSVLASLVPAKRATGLDPVEVLRAE